MTTPIPNVWNDRAAKRQVRARNAFRAWYGYGLELLRRNVEDPSSKTVLDIGCGVGELIELLQDLGYTAMGVDGNSEQVKIVKSLGVDAHEADLEQGLPFADGSFDVATCMEVIEHIARAEALLGEIRRILRDGGFLLLSTPNHAYLTHRANNLLGRPPWGEGVHLRFFTPSSLRAALRQAGFDVVAQSSFGPIPLWSSVAPRVFQSTRYTWRVPRTLEGVLAQNLVYLARRR